jgi:hypothetical protein
MAPWRLHGDERTVVFGKHLLDEDKIKSVRSGRSHGL